MNTVYLTSDAGKLHRSNQTLVYVAPDGTRSIIHPHQTSQLVVQGRADLTSAAITLLMKHGIQTVFLSKNGRFNGKVDFGPRKNVAVRVEQHRRLEDARFRMSWGRSIAEAKVRNQLNFMQRMGRKGKGAVEDSSDTTRSLKEALSAVESAENVESLRGLEGWSAKCYFSIFGRNITPEWAEFGGRSMNPPRDNVNAVLSFVYTLLRYRVEAAVLAEQLDPYIGYLHAIGFGKEALVYDLMEQFRTPVGDTVASALFNLGTLSEEDFRRETIESLATEEGGFADDTEISSDELTAFEAAEAVLLTKGGIRKTIEQFERKLSTEVFVPTLGKRLSYRRLIPEYVRRARRYIVSETDSLETFVQR